MTFQAPLLLGLLAVVPLAAAAYVLFQRRPRKFAVRYTNVDLLATVAGRSWTRHLPAVLALLALAALLVAVARPERTVAAERREATVLLVFDTSGSMLATDVQPSRLAAAQGAGMTFTDAVPDEFRIGVIGFGSSAQQLSEPTTDHARVKATISSLQVKGATAMGDAIKLAIDSARVPVPDGLGGSRRLPAAIVLLGDGASTRGDDPIDIVQQNKKYKIPIYTVALGSQNGTLTHTNPNTGATTTEPVPARPADAAGHRARHRRPVLRHRRRAQARGGLPQPRNAADEDDREAPGHVGLRRRRARAADGGRGLRARALREAAVSRARIVPPSPERTPAKPGPGPVPPQVLRSLDLAVMKRIESLVPGEHLTPQVGSGTELAMIRPYLPGRRRPPHRLERDRATARAARAGARRRARADDVARARRLGLDGLRHGRPAQGRRRRGRLAGRRPRRHPARQPARRAGLRRWRPADHAPAPGPARPARAARGTAPRGRRRRARERHRWAGRSPAPPHSAASAGSS